MKPSYRRWVEPLMVIAAIVITGIPAAIFYLHGEPSNSASTGTSFQEEKFAQIALNVPGTVKATLYFGQLNAITAYLKGQVQFNLPKGSRGPAPNDCAETIVFANVPGARGAVYALGLNNLDEGQALELPPNQQISQPFRTLHQQIIATSPTLNPGSTWQISARLQTDTASLTTQRIKFLFQTTNGSSQLWFINDNQFVYCDPILSL